MPKRAGRGTETKLQEALLLMRSVGRQTNQELAASAGVSTNTLRQITKGEFANEPTPSPKQVRGYAESLTRLSLYCELEPESVLPEYRLDLKSGDVRAGMDRVLLRRVPQWAVSDPVLDRIFERGGDVRVGILRWEPFVQVDGGPDQTWAWKDYMRPLLGTVNPLWTHTPSWIETIGKAIHAVQSRKKDECDLVFGVYDTAYRRTLGLAFIPLPGIGAPLGVVYEKQKETVLESAAPESSSDDGQRIWEDLLEKPEDFKALALREEAGHLFLKGICGFPAPGTRTTGPELGIIDEGHTENLAFEFLRSVVEGRATDFRRRVFVADRPTCNWVISQIRDHLETILAKNRIQDVGLRARYSQAASSVQLVDPASKDLAPVYPVSIAVRADAERWEELLRTATRELFRNSSGLVARAYAGLLKVGAPVLRPLPLGADIPQYQAREFAAKVAMELAKVSKQWSPEAKEVWLVEAQRIWCSG